MTTLNKKALIEKMAIAICYAENYCLHPESKKVEEFQKHRPYYTDQAKAALRALAEALPDFDFRDNEGKVYSYSIDNCARSYRQIKEFARE